MLLAGKGRDRSRARFSLGIQDSARVARCLFKWTSMAALHRDTAALQPDLKHHRHLLNADTLEEGNGGDEVVALSEFALR